MSADKTTLQRIEQAAEDQVKDEYSIDYQYEHFFIKGFKAGAIAERPIVRAEVIDEVKLVLRSLTAPKSQSELEELLEQLKLKP